VLVPIARLPFENHFRQFRHFGCYRMRPWFAEAKSDGYVLGGGFRLGFDGRTERIAQCARIFLVGVVNPPQFVFVSRSQIHADQLISNCAFHCAHAAHSAAQPAIRLLRCRFT
jgi:hypothetical protein